MTHSALTLIPRLLEILRLAAPTIAMRSGGLLMVMTDIVLLGQYNSEELAFYSLSQGPVMAMVLTGLGLLMGTLVLTSQEFGSGRLEKCGAVWQRSLPYGLISGLIIFALCATGPQLYIWLGQTEHLAQGASDVAFALGAGIPGYLMYLSSAYFLEGLKRPWPGTIFMLSANVLNIILNLWWINGGWGVEAMGSTGAAWATTASRYAMCIAAGLWVWTMRDHAKFGIRTRAAKDPKAWAIQRRLGYGAGLSIGIEGAAFGSLNVMSGWAGATALAAYGIGINLLGLVFMMSLGVGGASSVLVGHAYGAKNYREAAIAGWTGLGLNTLLALPIMACFAMFPLSFARIYTDDPAVLQVTAALLMWIAIMLPFDGGQAVMNNVLRGRGEAFMPAVLQSCAFAFLMVPCGYLFSTGLLPGAEGLFAAILVGTAASSTLLSLRFWWLARKDQRRMKKSGQSV